MRIKSKELIICVLTLVVLSFTITSAYASSTINDLNELFPGNTNTNTNTNTNNIIQEPPANNTTITPTNNTTITPSNNQAINSANSIGGNNVTGLPDTGINDSIVFIIAICGISALYAYKKIKDYNIRY